MSSTWGSMWPYLLLAGGWSAVCGGLLLRAGTSHDRAEPPNGDSDGAPSEGPGHEPRDTQAGRM